MEDLLSYLNNPLIVSSSCIAASFRNFRFKGRVFSAFGASLLILL